MQFIQLGSLTIPLQWLFALVSILAGWLVVKIYAKSDPLLKDSLDVVINSLFVWGIVWKFSVIIFDFFTVRHQLLSILYFSGGTKGFFLGMVVGIILMFWSGKKKKLLLSLSVVILLMGTAAYGLYLMLTAIAKGESMLTLIAYGSTTIIFTIWLWEKNIEKTLQQKAGMILIVFGLLFQINSDLSVAELGIPMLIPLLSIIFNNVAVKKEKL